MGVAECHTRFSQPPQRLRAVLMSALPPTAAAPAHAPAVGILGKERCAGVYGRDAILTGPVRAVPLTLCATTRILASQPRAWVHQPEHLALGLMSQHIVRFFKAACRPHSSRSSITTSPHQPHRPHQRQTAPPSTPSTSDCCLPHRRFRFHKHKPLPQITKNVLRR